MIKRVLDYVEKYRMIEENDTIVAGISGGADSVCLLFVLLELAKTISFKIKVVHINHKIREDAGEDVQFVSNLCKELQIPFFLVEESIPERAASSGLSEEEEGRKVRYEAFQRVLGEEKGHIAVAHNSNDRAETMLFHLFRGTGLTGASGIKPVNNKIIRPLLCVTRSEIENWLFERKITFCQDSTNEEDIYTRNRIRHHILPYAEKEICQGTVVNMNRAADDLLMAEEFAVRKTQEAIARCVVTEKPEIVINLTAFHEEDDYLKGRILLALIEKVAGSRKDITATHIRGIESLFEGTGSKELHLPYHLTVYKKYDLGMIQSKCEVEKEDLASDLKEYTFPIPGKVIIPELGEVQCSVFSREKSENIPQKTYTKWFDYDKINSSVTFRTKHSGDYLTINQDMGRKSLQDYFVNEKIPKDERKKIYFLAENSHVIWIPGYRISEYYKVSEDTRRILQVVLKKCDCDKMGK